MNSYEFIPLITLFFLLKLTAGRTAQLNSPSPHHEGGLWGAGIEGRVERQEGSDIYYTGPLDPRRVCSILSQRREILRCREL